jgi:hypothetical protein
LAIVFVLELGAGLSIFAYRTKLTEGFDKGLSQAMVNYRNNTGHLANDFDVMQETVSIKTPLKPNTIQCP